MSLNTAELTVNVPIRSGTGSDGVMIETGSSEGFRISRQESFFGANNDAMVIEKTDGNGTVDGGIAFVNTDNVGTVTPSMVISSLGNVGIGTIAPGAYKLNVAGNTNITGNLNVAGAISGTISINSISQLDSSVTVTDSGSGSIIASVDGAIRMEIGSLQINLNGKEAFRTNDSYLRLNHSNHFNSGLYTPGAMRIDGIMNFYSGTVSFGSAGSQLLVGDGSSAWYLQSNHVSASQIILRVSDDGVNRGRLVANTSNDIGFQDMDGQWAYRTRGDTGHYWLINNTQYMTLTTSGLSVTGTIAASGGFNGALAGNATTATTLATARNFSLTGDATATAVSFNGGANVALATSVVRLQGRALAATAPTTNQALIWNGSAWTPGAPTVPAANVTAGSFGSGNFTVTGTFNVTGSSRATTDMRSPIWYDSDNTAFRVDGNGTTMLTDLRSDIWYDRNNTGYYVDGDSSSNLNVLTVNEGYTNNWWRVNAAGGIYWQAYGGGWNMQDSTYIRAYGGKYVLAAGYYHTSDARLKHDVRPFRASGLATVEGLRAVHFKWNSDNREELGVIAQETEKVLPEAVNTDEKGFKQVQYDKLVLPVIEAVKELHAMVVKLIGDLLDTNTEVATLKAELEKQRAAFDARIGALEQRCAVNDNDPMEAEKQKRRGAAR